METATQAISPEALNQIQETLLRELWQSPNPAGFPTSVDELADTNDTEGLLESQLEAFVDQLRDGTRCGTCASDRDVEAGVCDDCRAGE